MWARLTGLTLTALLVTAAGARAQGQPDSPPTQHPVFAGASFAFWMADPGLGAWRQISPFSVTVFRRSRDWLVPAVTFNAGVVVTGRWHLGGEFLWRGAPSTPVLQAFRGHLTSYDLSMQYSHRELLASAVIGRSFAGESKWLSQIVGGFTISDSTQSLTELQGVQRYEGKEVPLTAPDVHEQSIRPGVTAGADFMRALGRALDANIMIRLHWLDRGPEPAFSRDRFPRPSARIILAGGGLRWGGRGKRP